MNKVTAFVLRLAIAGIVTAGARAGDGGVVATATVTSGPHAGSYRYSTREACTLAALPGRPMGFNVVLEAEYSTLSIDIPNVDAAHVNEASIELVVAEVKPGQSRKDVRPATYNVDTRPDAVLAPYERADRKGVTGKSTMTLTRSGDTARLSFRGSTAAGIQISGTVECRKLDSAYAR